MNYNTISLLFLLVIGNCFAAETQSGHIRGTKEYIMSLKLKKDSYRRDRGGNSAVYEISCTSCLGVVMYYQKDGFGRLLRCYLDRIMYPKSLEDLAHDSKIKTKQDMPNLRCQHCDTLIGVPMAYGPDEGRLAFRMLYGKFATNILKKENKAL